MEIEKIWLESYSQGTPAELPVPESRSLRETIERAFERHADRRCYTNMGTTLTYRDVDRLSLRFASYLQNTLGLIKGERVAIMLPNILQYPVALFGIFRAGLVAVNVNPMYTARELRHQLSDSGARCIIVLENFAHTVQKVIGDTAVDHVITTQVGDLLKFPKRQVVNFALKHVKKSIPSYSLPESTAFRAALRVGKRNSLKPVELGYADLAFLQYTGGTTGLSKGAMLSHRNMVFNIDQSLAWIGDTLGDKKDVVAITALPLYHIFSLQSNCLSIMVDGGENILITDPRDMRGFVREMAKHKFVYFTGVNTLFAGLLNTPGFADLDFSSLKMSVGGGMAVQEAVSKKWKEVTGQHITQAYGLTETSPAAIINLPGSDEFTGSIGLPITSTEVCICDDAGNNLDNGEIGEICIRGPQVMEGYWRNEEETKNVMLPGGWFRTGDVGRMDEHGFVYIEDRKKDMILVSGFNVYPNEIEGVVAELDGVLEVAAIGKPHEKSGEIVKLFVVKSDPSLTEDQIMQHCRDNLTNYKVPKAIEFRDELPKTNVGKILRRELREQ